MFDFLYEVDAEDRSIYAPLGDKYKPPVRFEHCKDVLTAHIPKSPEDGDGHAVDIYEARLPATFYTLHVLPGVNSMGEPQPGYKVGTGSGGDMGRLAVQLAIAISEGMIGFKPIEEKK